MSKLTLEQLDAGIDSVVRNATSLVKEANLLLKSGFHARAFTLAHIAREELAKVTMFYSSGLRMLAGTPVEWVKLHKRLRDHKSKLTSDALLSMIATAGAAEALPIEKIAAGSEVRNQWKNDSLYVGLKGGKFQDPSEMITPQKAERTVAIATFALEDTIEYLSVGGKLTKRDPEKVKEFFRKALTEENLKPENALKILAHLSHVIAQTRAQKAQTKSSDDPEEK